MTATTLGEYGGAAPLGIRANRTGWLTAGFP